MLDMIHSLVVSTETLYQHPTVSAKGKCIKVRFTRAPFKPLSDQERIRYPSFSLTKNDCLKLWFLSKKTTCGFQLKDIIDQKISSIGSEKKIFSKYMSNNWYVSRRWILSTFFIFYLYIKLFTLEPKKSFMGLCQIQKPVFCLQLV